MAELELPVLEPPPDGLARLRERIAADDRRHAKLRWLALPALAIAAVIVVWLARPHAYAPASSTPSTLLRDPSIDGVAFYWVAPTTNPTLPHSSPAFIDISTVTISP
jgi:hypothetical protein